MSRLEGKVAVVTGASATYVECVQPVKAGDVPAIRLLQGRGSPDRPPPPLSRGSPRPDGHRKAGVRPRRHTLVPGRAHPQVGVFDRLKS